MNVERLDYGTDGPINNPHRVDPPQTLAAEHHETFSRLANLPRSLGWFLLLGGLMSEVIMGLPPFWILGILILWPKSGARLVGLLHRRAPKSVQGGVGFVNRFLVDLDRRYP